MMHVDEAERHLAKATQIAGDMFGDDSEVVAQSLIGIGYALLALRDILRNEGVRTVK